MRIRITDPAQSDLIDGFVFYEEREIGLGQYFLDCLYSDIDSLQLYAGIHPKKYDFYWMLSKRFPFTIYYEIEENWVYVHAVMDCRQNPENIELRLKEERNRN